MIVMRLLYFFVYKKKYKPKVEHEIVVKHMVDCEQNLLLKVL